MSSPLERLADLSPEPPDAREFAGLKRAGFARLKDAGDKGEYEGELDVDDRFVTDLIAACGAVAKALANLKPL